MLQATFSDVMGIIALRDRIDQLERNWPRDVKFYEPLAFRDTLLSVYDAANAAYTFERSYADRYMWKDTRAKLRREVERIYGAGGTLDVLNQKYLQAMKTGLAQNAQVEAPEFRADVLRAMREILDAYETIVYTQAGEDFMDSDIAQKSMAAFETFSTAVTAIVHGAGSVAQSAGRAVVKAAKATGSGLGKIVIIAVIGASAVSGLFYLLSVRRKRQREQGQR